MRASAMSRALALLLILLGGCVLVLSVGLAPSTPSEVDFNVEAARGFLESQYVPEAGLLRAAVNAYPDNATMPLITCWLSRP